VKACHWDDKAFVWHVYVVDANGNTQHWTADVLCQCIGTLDRPKFGTTPGREIFKGESWHTAYWRHDYDLKGKKVAIVGCGPSAAQIIPEIVDKVEHLTVYMRTPPLCIPRGDYKYSKSIEHSSRLVSWDSLLTSLQIVLLGRALDSILCILRSTVLEFAADL
jgi:cation diffusion facilitator CzcD-associated flavoprotein CzcO